MPTFHGLYYPYLHFQDEGWLKAAALYWDGMNRIVPYGARLDDSDEVKRFEQDGFVARQDPYEAAYEIAEPFRELLRERGKASALPRTAKRQTKLMLRQLQPVYRRPTLRRAPSRGGRRGSC
jgi:hypothetical protein